MPRESSRSSSTRRRQALRDAAESARTSSDPLGIFASRPRSATVERDESLLCSVVQVALDAPSAFVGRGDHAGAGGGELVAAVRIRDRGGEQFCELGQALLRVGGRLVMPSPACGDHAPQRAVDDDRRPDRGVDVVAPEYLRNAAAPLLREIESSRASRAQDAGIHAVAIKRQTHSGAEDLRALAANRKDRDFVLVLVAGQADLGCSEQLAHLGDDGVEYLGGRGSLGDERRDPAQRGLLVREFASPRFRGGELGTAVGVRDRRRQRAR